MSKQNKNTAPNKRQTLRRLPAARVTKRPVRAVALCGLFLRHIFAVAGIACAIPLSQQQKRRLPRTLCAIYSNICKIMLDFIIENALR